MPEAPKHSPEEDFSVLGVGSVPGEGPSPPPILVSGLPRSGTSMLMRMLGAGGIPLLTDESRGPDANNRLGYFEFAPVKDSARDVSWLREARGKAVKVVTPLLRYVPPEVPLRLLVMHRPLDQVMSSQEAMIRRRGGGPSADRAVEDAFVLLMETLPAFLEERPHWQVLHLSYEAVLADPVCEAQRLACFMGGKFDPLAAAGAVDETQRRFA